MKQIYAFFYDEIAAYIRSWTVNTQVSLPRKTQVPHVSMIHASLLEVVNMTLWNCVCHVTLPNRIGNC